MGFNSWVTHLMLASQDERAFDSAGDIGLGGRQTVFLNKGDLAEIAKSYELDDKTICLILDSSDIDHETLRSRGGIPDWLFTQTLFNLRARPLDATTYEGASEVLDLNRSYSEQPAEHLLSTMEAVYDGGSLDNVFNPAMAIKNLASLLRSEGRIYNWVCASNWPGAFCMISPEWLFGFYAANGFKNIRAYVFHPVIDGSTWPNLSAHVFRYSPWFTRSSTWDPWDAMRQSPGHPLFVLCVAECEEPRKPEHWIDPMQSHYLGPDALDWRQNYESTPDLPFRFTDSIQDSIEPQPLGPYASDHFSYIGVLAGLPQQFPMGARA